MQSTLFIKAVQSCMQLCTCIDGLQDRTGIVHAGGGGAGGSGTLETLMDAVPFGERPKVCAAEAEHHSLSSHAHVHLHTGCMLVSRDALGIAKSTDLCCSKSCSPV